MTKPFSNPGLYLLLVLFASCSKAHFIPELGAGWKNLASSASDVFNFNENDPGSYKSDFEGTETVGYSNLYNFSGSYENHDIHFTFSSGPNSGVTYSGTINGSGQTETITLGTPTGQIVLTR